MFNKESKLDKLKTLWKNNVILRVCVVLLGMLLVGVLGYLIAIPASEKRYGAVAQERMATPFDEIMGIDDWYGFVE